MILPVTWEADINRSVGSATISESGKVVSKELWDELCDFISAVKLRAQESSLDTSTPAGAVFKVTFLTEENNISEEYMSTIAET